MIEVNGVKFVTVYDGEDKPISVPWTGDWRDILFENRWACIPCDKCPDERGYLCDDCTDWVMVLHTLANDYEALAVKSQGEAP